MQSEMEHFAVGSCSVCVYLGLQPGVSGGFQLPTHQTHSVGLKQRLEQISTTHVEHSLDLVVARVLPETLVK